MTIKKAVGWSVIIFFPVIFVLWLAIMIFVATPVYICAAAIKIVGEIFETYAADLSSSLKDAKDIYERAWVLISVSETKGQ